MTARQLEYRRMLERLGFSLVEEHGFTGRELDEAEERLALPGPMPQALRDWYRACGRHPLNQVHDELLSPDALDVEDDYLVFFEAHQRVVVWGIRLEDLRQPNPTVWQGVPEDGWYSEELCLRDFFRLMSYRQIVMGGYDYHGVVDPAPPSVVERTNEWSELGEWLDERYLEESGRIVCIGQNGDSYSLNGAAMTRDGFVALTDAMGVEWDYSTLMDESP